MGQYAGPLLIAVAAIALTYFFCLRPMRRQAGGSSSACCLPSRPDAASANEIKALSREIEALRQSMADPADAGPSDRVGQADITN